ncbi:MAG: hypothetical protein SFW36_14220 [Leptolyngbyaceae cyanobacterium bins.59]|nr:hypothetical protein [Leptolyngbyaceae cyanobacterium bins.59]
MTSPQATGERSHFGMVRSQKGVEWVIVCLEWNAPYKIGDRTSRE